MGILKIKKKNTPRAAKTDLRTESKSMGTISLTDLFFPLWSTKKIAWIPAKYHDEYGSGDCVVG